MINKLFDVIDRNRSAVKILKFMSSNVHRIYKKRVKPFGKQQRRNFVWEESIKGYLSCQQIILGHCQGGICLVNCSSLKSQV